MKHSHLSFANDFLKYFDVSFALTPEQKRDVYRIRYHVYCEEFKYEPAECFPNREESDEFDPQSLHCLITHKSSRMPAACGRMISPAGPYSQGHLPFEKHCSDRLEQMFLDKLEAERHTVCELSRLAVERAFRRCRGACTQHDHDVEWLECSRQERRTFGLISLACTFSTFAMSSLAARPNAFCLTTPAMSRYLERFGLHLQRAGEAIEFRGWRAPYFIRAEEVRETIPADLHDLYDTIFARLKQDFPTARL